MYPCFFFPFQCTKWSSSAKQGWLKITYIQIYLSYRLQTVDVPLLPWACAYLPSAQAPVPSAYLEQHFLLACLSRALSCATGSCLCSWPSPLCKHSNISLTTLAGSNTPCGRWQKWNLFIGMVSGWHLVAFQQLGTSVLRLTSWWAHLASQARACCSCAQISPCLYSRKTSPKPQPLPEHNQPHSSSQKKKYPKWSYLLNTALYKNPCDSFQISGLGKEFRNGTRMENSQPSVIGDWCPNANPTTALGFCISYPPYKSRCSGTRGR